MIEIVKYMESWPDEFNRIGDALRTALGDLALRIDHIGSTSVPFLDAKDIIDVQLTVQRFEPFQQVRASLVLIGYTFMSDIQSDHRPPWADGPDMDWEKRYFRPPLDQRPSHLHVRAAGRANQRYALLFRDHLRQHPNTAAAYAALKHRLAGYHGQSDDHSAYVLIKDPVCDVIMSAAHDWAADSGWQPGSTDA